MKIEMIYNASYCASDVMHFRGMVNREEMAKLIKELDKHIISNKAEKTGICIVAIHTLYFETRVMDAEVFIPLSKKIPPSKDFQYLQNFNLKSCLMAKHENDLCILPEMFTEIYHHATNIGLSIKQPFYVVTKECPTYILGLLTAQADIYIKTKPYLILT